MTCEGETPLYYGSRCEKYDVVRRVKGLEGIDLFKVREKLLHDTYGRKDNGGEVIGLPKILNMHELLPFWGSFLAELGFSVVLSDPTNKKIIKEGVETIIVESCFPIKLAHGHILNIVNKGIHRIFMPSVINMRKQSESTLNSFACPYAQSLPYTSRASIDFDELGVKVESPVVFFGKAKTALANLTAFGKSLGKSKKEIADAFAAAEDAQDRFYRACLDEGSRFLADIKPGEKVMVLVGRPYNSMDPGANLNVHKKLSDLGVASIPIDMLPLDSVPEDDDLKDMYWGYGQKILRAAKIIRSHPNLYGIYITNFGCGPDSFITHFFKQIMEGKPFLQLEIDEHSGDAGIITRLEAFLDSIKNAKTEAMAEKPAVSSFMSDGHARKIYIPYMSDHAIPFVGAFRACGVEAEVMRESDEETVQIGRKHTLGKECFPCILTTGDMLKTSKRAGFRSRQECFLHALGKRALPFWPVPPLPSYGAERARTSRMCPFTPRTRTTGSTRSLISWAASS